MLLFFFHLQDSEFLRADQPLDDVVELLVYVYLLLDALLELAAIIVSEPSLSPKISTGMPHSALAEGTPKQL